ncbi:ATP-binding protein [Streptomyces sp. NPDC001139]
MVNGDVGALWEREAECAAIADVLKEAMQGQGGMLLVQGPAGIGKSRLLAEARAQAGEANAGVAAARASELERDFAFGVVRQLFEPLLTGSNINDTGLWAGPASSARLVFQSAGQLVGSAGDFAVLHGLYWLTANICQDRPMLLAIDDLQWCDAPSLRFLAYLLPRLDDLPLLLTCAVRTGEPATDERLLARLATDSAVDLLQPGPLSEKAGACLLAQIMEGPPEEAFAAACHTATGGNPLLLHTLARTLADQHLGPTVANTDRITEIGSHAVARVTAARLARLPETTRTLAHAVAVLGDHTDLVTSATLARQDTTTALGSVTKLERAEILRAKDTSGTLRLSFVHPLVREAVYDILDMSERARWHHAAARLLAAADADPEQVAAHLLRVPPGSDPDTTATLSAAAAVAIARGAPGNAHTYLHRALTERLPAGRRQELLFAAGQAAMPVDLEVAVDHLQQIDASMLPVHQQVQVALMLGMGLFYTLRGADATALLSDALDRVPEPETDLRRRLQALILGLLIVDVGREKDIAQLHGWWDLPPDDSIGGRMLDCVIAFHDMKACVRSAVERARRGLADGVLIEEANGETSTADGWVVLLTADTPEAKEVLDHAVTHARQHGSLRDLAPALAFRALVWQRAGYLSEAEADASASCRMVEASNFDIGRPWVGPYLADILIDQGRLAEAADALNWIGLPEPLPEWGPFYLALETQARLRRLQGQPTEALNDALASGRYWTAAGGANPAFIAWRSEAALCLHHLGNGDEARDYVVEELRLAKQWGAPRSVGHALRVLGLVSEGPDGLDHLKQATDILRPHPACRLEYTKALAETGAALRRAGHRHDARTFLREALDLATQSGATPLADFVGTELAAAGGRPRRTTLNGPRALTPSEHRIATLAAAGATNRQIAQQLYVTPKTVEVHLSAVYRKLDITTRTHLANALTRSPSHA